MDMEEEKKMYAYSVFFHHRNEIKIIFGISIQLAHVTFYMQVFKPARDFGTSLSVSTPLLFIESEQR